MNAAEYAGCLSELKGQRREAMGLNAQGNLEEALGAFRWNSLKM